MIELKLPYPPSGNHMWKHTKKGHHYLTDVARAYYDMVRLIVISEGKLLNLNQQLMVICRLSPPDRRKRDLDNCWKVIGDALTKANLWQDDKYIRHLALIWDEPVEGGAVSVTVQPFGKTVEETLSC